MNYLSQQRETLETSVAEVSLELLRSFLHQVDEPFARQVADVHWQQFWTIYPTDSHLLKSTLHWFDTLNLQPLSHRVLLECKTMLGEAVDNVRDHAHEHLLPSTPIPIVITLCPALLSLQIWDQGKGFDLAAYLQSKQQWPDSGATRGRGLKILDELSDYFGYLCNQPLGNCLILLKKIALDSENLEHSQNPECSPNNWTGLEQTQ
jgi:serine/threonine-protein kinase RsbW